MKHTMKKLLCVALAIMLLVSAVPVFAAADSTNKVIEITIETPDGNKFKTITEDEAGGAPNWTDEANAIAWAVEKAGGLDGTYDHVSLTTSDNGYVAVIKYWNDPVYRDVHVTFKTPNGATVGTLTYSDEIGAPNWNNDGAAAWAMERAGLSYDHAEVLDASDPYNATIKVYNDAPVVPEKEVVVTFKTPSGDVTWSYKPSTYATESNNGGAPNWSAEAVKWAMNEAVKAGKLTKNFKNAQLISVGPDSYTATIKVFDDVSTTDPTTPGTAGKLELTIRVNGTKKYDNDVKNFTSATVASVIKNIYESDWTSKYAFDKVVVNGVTYGRSDLEVRAGDEVDIYLTRKYSKDNSNKVYLHVYLNGDASTIAMTKDITGTYLMDDWKTDTNEILNYLKYNYYTAKDTSNAITIDGLYVSTDTKGAFPGNYYADNKTASKDNIDELLEDGYVHISVMLKNAKAKSTSTADSSNPKTGDTIFVPVMVMGVTGTVLAAAYVFGKKRFAR